MHAEDGDHETVRPLKKSRYSWLSGGYVFPVVVKSENLTFEVLLVLFDFCPQTIGILSKLVCTSGQNLV